MRDSSVKVTSEVNPHYTAEVGYRNVEFFYQEAPIGNAQLKDGSPEARKVLRYLAITEKPFCEVLCFYRVSQQLLGADILEMSVSEDGKHILHADKVIGKRSDYCPERTRGTVSRLHP